MKLDNESLVKALRNNIYLGKQLFNNRKRVILIETKNHTILSYIKNYIFTNDIIVFFNNSINDDYMKNIIKSHDKRNVIIF